MGLRRDLGLAGAAHAKETFSWDVAASQFDEYITALANVQPTVVTEAPTEAAP